MKTLIKTFSLAILVSITLFSCSKSGSSVTPAASSSWTIAGSTYKGSYTYISSNGLLSKDGNVTGDPIILIQFNTAPVAGSYTVTTPAANSGASNECYFSAQTADGTNLFSSNGGTVTVTVSGGKVTASFNAIPVGTIGAGNNGVTYTTTGTTTGKLVQQ